MRNFAKGKRKSWIREALAFQNQPATIDIQPQGKYSMYLSACNRPQTTSVLLVPQPGYRTYVAHTGGNILPQKACAHHNRFQAQSRGLGMRNNSLGTPGAISPGSKKPRQLNKEKPEGGHSLGCANSAHKHVFSPISGNKQCGGMVGSWGICNHGQHKLSGGRETVSPFSKKQDLSTAAMKKPKQTVLPKKEIIPKKLLKEVNRPREHPKHYRKEANNWGAHQFEAFLSERIQKQDGRRESTKRCSSRMWSNWMESCKNASSHHAPLNKRGFESSNSLREGRENLQHPLHESALRSSQRMLSRTSYCEQLSRGRNASLRGLQKGPHIVTPQLELSDDSCFGRDQKMQGKMLVSSLQIKQQRTVPPTAPGALGVLDFNSSEQREKLDKAHSCKWTDPKESPRVKGWKLGHSKVDSVARRMTVHAPTALTTPDDLIVEVEGSRHSAHKLAGSRSDVDRLHELLLLCDQKGADEKSSGHNPFPLLSQAESEENPLSKECLPENRRPQCLAKGESINKDALMLKGSSHDRYENGFRLLADKYEVLTVVGEGAYGLVMKCRILDAPESFVAIKEFKLEEGDSDAEEVKRTMHREVQVLSELQHPHVVQTMEHFAIGEKVFIVMEFIPKNLLEVLEEKGDRGMERDSIRQVISQVVSAIAFIHQQGMVYRDIKPENILITKQGNAKLCDFGFARRVDQEDALTDYVATRWYRAPELLLGQPFESNGAKIQCPYGKPVDMWSIGCLMGELLDGEPLFAGDSDIDQLYKIQQILGPLVKQHDDIFRNNPNNQGIVFNIKTPLSLEGRYLGKANALELSFMQGLLQMDPQKRLTSQACLNHEYLQQHAASLAIC